MLYPWCYLLYSMIFVSLLVFLLVTRPDLRRPVAPFLILGGIMGPVSEVIFYLRDYWRPDTMLGPGRVSIEDVLFGASIYGLAVIVYPFITRRSIVDEQKFTSTQQFRRAAIVFGLGIVLAIPLNYWLGINSVPATSAVFLAEAAYMIMARPDLLKISLITSTVLAAFALGLYAIGLNVVGSSFLDAWWLAKDTAWGITILGNVPLTEIIWFFAAGCYMPAFYFYATGRRPSLVRVAASQRMAPEAASQPLNEYLDGRQAVD